MKPQSSRRPTLTPLAQLLATSLAALALPALAQTAEAPDAAKSDVASLDRVVTTATSSVKSKMRSSVTVTVESRAQARVAEPAP